MKKLKIFLIFLLLSSKSFSQTDTSKVDSLICLPKSLITLTVQDLVKCDGDREELIILKDNIELKDQYISTQDSIIKTKDLKINDYKTTIFAYQQVDTAHINITNALNDKVETYRKERNWYRIAAVILLVVTLIR
jgi:hypothetical protein